MDWGNMTAALAAALRQRFAGQQQAPAQVVPAGQATRQAFASAPASTAGMANSDNRSAYVRYVEDTMTAGQDPLSYRDWLQQQGGVGAPGAPYAGAAPMPQGQP